MGISRYQNLKEKDQLKYADRDAESIYRILISQEGGNYPPEHVHLLTEQKATLANMQREIDSWLVSVAKEGDRVLIYFAGHGFILNGRAYLAPFDFIPEYERAAQTAYPMETLGRMVGTGIKAKNKIIFTDACHSGALLPETNPAALNGALIDLKRSTFSLTASREDEVSVESPAFGGGHGVFTYFLEKGLEGEADQNHDGIVTADELGEYVRVNVRQQTGTKQNPTSDRGNYDRDLLLAYNPSKRATPLPTPQFGTLHVVSNVEGVELFVDGISRGTLNGKPLPLPGLTAGPHSIKAFKMGYEPDGPRDEMVFPGEETTVTVRIVVRSHRNSAAVSKFEAGVASYQKGYDANYRKAVDDFKAALKLDPKYSEAAMYLGRTYSALNLPESAKLYFKNALKINPDYVEAQVSYAGMLLDLGDVAESIRQLAPVLQTDPANALGQSMQAQALFRQDQYAESVAAARESIRLRAVDAEPHFWLAEALRLGAEHEKDPARSYHEAYNEYAIYLRLSDFDSKLAGKLNYYVLGFLIGLGRKTHAAQEDIWKDLRSIAYAGMGDCARLLDDPEEAIPLYQRALHFGEKDPLVHFGLAVAFVRLAEKTQAPEGLAAAKVHFEKTIELNAGLKESELAKKALIEIDAKLKELAAAGLTR
jgi:tetratricopeptide (TPR) repeat protein